MSHVSGWILHCVYKLVANSVCLMFGAGQVLSAAAGKFDKNRCQNKKKTRSSKMLKCSVELNGELRKLGTILCTKATPLILQTIFY